MPVYVARPDELVASAPGRACGSGLDISFPDPPGMDPQQTPLSDGLSGRPWSGRHSQPHDSANARSISSSANAHRLRGTVGAAPPASREIYCGPQRGSHDFGRFVAFLARCGDSLLTVDDDVGHSLVFASTRSANSPPAAGGRRLVVNVISIR